MLGWMRKQTRSWVVYVGVGAIIIVFIFFYGFGSRRGAKELAIVALVSGQKITRRQYDEAYQNLLAFTRSIYKRSLSEEEIKQLRQKALDDLVDRTLMLQEAGRRGLKVGSEEVKREIATTPAFQAEGVFNKELYLRQLAARRMTPSEYERAVRMELLISKLADVVQNTTKLTEKELLDLYRLENERVGLKILKLNALDLENQAEVSPEEAQKYYETTKEAYKVPTRVKIRYLSFDPERYGEEVGIKPEEIDEFYRLNEDRFMQGKRVRARHILIEAKGEKGGKTEENARGRAEEIRKRIEEGEDFSQLAQELSQDAASSSKGGDLGYFERGQMVKDFEEAAFSLKPGELSPVVRTPRGFHIIKVEDLQEERLKPLEKVRDVIEEELKVGRAEELAEEEARRAIGQIYRSGDLVGYAEKNGLSIQETGFFSEGEPIEGIGINRDFGDTALLLKKGEVSPVISLGKRYLILQLAERKESYLPAFKEVEEKVVRLVRRQKAKEMAREKAEGLLKELATGASMDQVASREGLAIEKTGLFTRRSGFIGKIGFSEELVKEAFSLTPESPFPKKAYGIGNSYFVVALEEREEIEQEKFQSQKEKIRERLLAQKRGERIRLWLKGLKERAEVEISLTI